MARDLFARDTAEPRDLLAEVAEDTGKWVVPGDGEPGIPIISDITRSLYPFERNTKTGDLRPAVPKAISGAFDSLIDAIMAPGDALSGKMSDLEVDPMTGEIAPFNTQMIERAANAAGWMTGGVTPGNPGRLVTAAGSKVPRPVLRALDADGVPVGEVAARVGDIGPDGMVADLGRNLQAQASTLAGLPGGASDALIDALSARKAAGNGRIRAGLDDALGEAVVPSDIHADLTAGRRAVGPEYDAALSGAPPVDVTELAAGLNASIGGLRGRAQAALQTVRSMLNRTSGEGLDDSAATLFQIRQEIDGMLAAESDANVARLLKDARRQVEDILVEAAPGVRVADAKYRELARQGEAIDAGQSVLDSGRNAPRPAELADQVAEGVVPQGVLVGPSGAAFRLSQGARAEIDRIVGTNANDRAALERLVKGDGDWNRDRLVTLFGEDRANALFRILENERIMAETENAALRAGGKVPAAEAAAEISPQSKGPGVFQSAANLDFGDAAAKAADKTFGWLGRSRQSSMNDDIIEAIMGRGDWRTAGRRPQSPIVLPLESAVASSNGDRPSRASQDILDLLFQ